LIRTYDTTSTAKYNLMKRTALPIRKLIEAMDEEDISFYEQTTANFVIETNLDNIESSKRTTTQSERVERDRNEETRADGI
jgi:hypothetical protein